MTTTNTAIDNRRAALVKARAVAQSAYEHAVSLPHDLRSMLIAAAEQRVKQAEEALTRVEAARI